MTSDQPRYGERLPEPGPGSDGRVTGVQAPEYGEYAPAGWVNPVAPVDEPEAPDATAPGQIGTSTRPPEAPRGYNDGGYRATTRFDAPPPTGEPVPGPPPTAARPKPFNGFATFFLIVYGVYRVVSDALSTGGFADTYVAQFKRMGYLHGTFQNMSDLHTVALVSAFVSVPLFLIVCVVALRRLRAGKNSWLVLLVAGLVVNVTTGIAVVVVVMNDPSFAAPMVG
ncbi:hypothetical protein AX769_08820 [Frondihabitans sp. PAMC 28766]|uniref:DUF6264 family protein n=1 Tax=Frondihabitans sp. PAMC 28766 TaxID=1795630 RepID=UPI00078B97B1|nr:DUF6264 family protein [Frondihabitans sp. PAMC 28766]AMM20246.1 hypothetical protein AX769_08820 [Frondihabitans sp. PAMC 28766]